jgi:hypothetical protein
MPFEIRYICHTNTVRYRPDIARLLHVYLTVTVANRLHNGWQLNIYRTVVGRLPYEYGTVGRKKMPKVLLGDRVSTLWKLSEYLPGHIAWMTILPLENSLNVSLRSQIINGVPSTILSRPLPACYMTQA